jgi:hypothetical protein
MSRLVQARKAPWWRVWRREPDVFVLTIRVFDNFSKAIQRTQLSIVRFHDSMVDAGLADPPPGYWNERLVREIDRRSLRSRIRFAYLRLRALTEGATE